MRFRTRKQSLLGELGGASADRQAGSGSGALLLSPSASGALRARAADGPMCFRTRKQSLLGELGGMSR